MDVTAAIQYYSTTIGTSVYPYPEAPHVGQRLFIISVVN